MLNSIRLFWAGVFTLPVVLTTASSCFAGISSEYTSHEGVNKHANTSNDDTNNQILNNKDHKKKDEKIFTFNIPRQSLDSALVLFSIQTNIDIVGLNATLNKYTAPHLKGGMSWQQALEQLLANTGLEYRVFSDHIVSIVPTPASVKSEAVSKIANVDEVMLEEVLVSATRRSLNLQDTPIAVSAFDQYTLERNQVQDLRDISGLVPGLELIDTGPQAAILVQLRGVGTTNITEIADGPVATHIDGVYSPRSQAVAGLLYDVDRVEVLRGPQGTLFGRNSSSGSINVYSRQPILGRSEVDLSVAYGNFNHQTLRSSINIPIGEVFSLRIAGAVNKHDAYTDLIDNYAGLGPHYPASESELSDFDQAFVPPGQPPQEGPEAADQTAWRMSGFWQPTDKLSAWVSADRYRDNGTGIAELDPTLVNQGIRATVFDSPSFLNLTNDSLRSRIQYIFDNDITLAYTYGVSSMRRQQIFDADNGRDGSFEQQRTDSSAFRFNSHEIQILNGDQEKFQWLFGAYFSRERNSIVFAIDQQNSGAGRGPEGATSWISDDPGAAASYAVQPDRRVDSLGVFAQAAYDLGSRSTLTMGLRYTKDTKSDRGGRALNCRVTSVLGPYIEPGSIGPGAPTPEQIFADEATAAAIAAGLPHDNGTNEGIGDEPCWVRQVNDFSATWSNTSGLIRFDTDIHEDVMTYASIATGFKSGHIQDAGNSAEPETVINYELGVKSQFLHNSLRINAALYHADYDDLQFSNQDRLDTNGDGVADTGGSTVVRNASAATIQGLELEMEWALTAADHIQFVATFIDARFDRFEIPDSIFGDLFNPFVSELSTSTLDDVDLSGNAPPRTPDWKITFAYEHDFILPWGNLTPRILATFSDSYFLEIYNRNTLAAGVFDNVPNGGQNLGIQEAYEQYDASILLTSVDKHWSAELFVKNLTDENVKIASGNFITENGFVATYAPPRTFGFKVNYSFN